MNRLGNSLVKIPGHQVKKMDRLSELLKHAGSERNRYRLELWIEMYRDAMLRMIKLHDQERRSRNTIRDQKLLAIERLEVEVMLLNLKDLEAEICGEPTPLCNPSASPCCGPSPQHHGPSLR